MEQRVFEFSYSRTVCQNKKIRGGKASEQGTTNNFEASILEKERVVGPSWVNLKKRLHSLAEEIEIDIVVARRHMTLLSQRIDYTISGPRQNPNLFNKKLLGEGHVKFIGVG